MANFKKLVRARQARTGESYQSAERAVRREGLLRAVGVPDEAFEHWDEELLGLRVISGGHSASLEVALEQARENARLRNYGLDLGNYAMLISREKGEWLEEQFKAHSIPYKRGSVKWEWYRKKYPHALGRSMEVATKSARKVDELARPVEKLDAQSERLVRRGRELLNAGRESGLSDSELKQTKVRDLRALERRRKAN